MSDDESGGLERIHGIGPTYREQLQAAGIDTVGRLAAAEASAVAETTGIDVGRIRRWIDRAEDRVAEDVRADPTENDDGTESTEADDAGHDSDAESEPDSVPLADVVDKIDEDRPDDGQIGEDRSDGDRPDGSRVGEDPTDETPTETPTEDEENVDPADDAPLSDLAREVDERRGSDSVDDVFEEMAPGEVDIEDVWATVFGDADETTGSGDEDGDAGAVSQRVGVGAEAEYVGRAGVSDDREEHLVPKDKFCQQCPYIQAPPDLGCTYEGADIVEVVNAEMFRVRGCPMTADTLDDVG